MSQTSLPRLAVLSASVFALVLGLPAAIGQTPAQCATGPAYQLTATPVGSVVYDPFSGADLRVGVSLQARRTGNGGACAAQLAIASAVTAETKVSLKRGADILGAHFVRRGQDAKLNAGLLPLTESVVVPAFGGTGALELELVIPKAQLVRPGTYRVELSLRLQNQAGGLLGSVSSLPIDVVAPTIVQARFEGGGDYATTTYESIDLGDISVPSSATRRLIVRSTSPTSVTIESAGRGALVHQNEALAPKIAYNFRIDGTAVDLSGPSSRTLGASTDQVGRTLTIEVSAPGAMGAIAGAYRDQITFRIDAQ